MNDREPIKSVRGVYYDLTKSPYEYLTPYGDLLKFSSQKKLDIYTRDITKEKTRLDKVLERNNLQGYLTIEQITMLYRLVYIAFYKVVEK